VRFVLQMMRELRWHGPRTWDAKWVEAGAISREKLKALVRQWDEQDDPPLDHCDTLYRLGRETLRRWEAWLLAENARDFDALILDARERLLRPEGEAALAALRRRYRLLIIDEFQDTDGAQRDIAFRIAGLPVTPSEARGAEPGMAPFAPLRVTGDGPQLFLVGDPKQSIYRFRGADIAVWNEVAESLGAPLSLTRNFRSDPAVVGYVNQACAAAMKETAATVTAAVPESRIEYQTLEPGRKVGGTGAIESIDAVTLSEAKGAPARRIREAEMVAARIRQIVVDEARGDLEGITVVDPDSGLVRDCRYRDVAVLFRTRAAMTDFSQALARYGVPFYQAGDAGLAGQLEVLDVLTLLRLVANPLDDFTAFTWLRSPWVGLRDEVLARIRLEGGRGESLLEQARAFLGRGAWFEAPEHGAVAALEREGLTRSLALLDELVTLRSRVPIDQLVRLALERSGYALHLLLLPKPEPRLANLQRFLRVLEGYGDHTVGTFLELWERWEDEDLGVPQAPLYAKGDDVVTLSTIHAAKGLEWPVVFLVDLEGGFRDKASNVLWTDRALGPVLAPVKDDRGPRTVRLCERLSAEERAEESRVFYVAATRARDRLIVAVPGKPKGLAEWAGRGLNTGVPKIAEVPAVEVPPLPPEPSLAWIDRVSADGAALPLVGGLRVRRLKPARSATELMTWCRDRGEWRLRYQHGVLPWWDWVGGDAVIASRSAADDVIASREAAKQSEVIASGEAARQSRRLSPRIRGQLIHGVLERIRDEEELAELLDVVVGTLDAPELEESLARGSRVRDQLEAEIRGVVQSPEWRWYVEGPHWRELRFVDLRSPVRWHVGAFDLYRPGEPGLIVDFKTQDVEDQQAREPTSRYLLQAGLYQSAANRLSATAVVSFHFTRSGHVVRSNVLVARSLDS
jgi:ATP-dependent exoDNAse (exonuclease V) beta subunit